MKKFTTSERLKQIISERGIKQVDILELCKPFCEQHDIKLKKNDLSQYISGKVEPKQDKLSILGLALNVNEVWLMGYDVPPGRDALSNKESQISEESKAYDLIRTVFGEQVVELVHLFTSFNKEGQEKLLEYAKDLECSGNYKKADQDEMDPEEGERKVI